jgi:hypothetical protein
MNLRIHLDGQDDFAGLIRLAVPDQLHLTLVVEQEKTVLVRERLAGLDELGDFTFFTVGEFHGDGLSGMSII